MFRMRRVPCLATIFPLGGKEEKRGERGSAAGVLRRVRLGFLIPSSLRLVLSRLYVAISRGGSLHPCEPLRYSKWRHGRGVESMPTRSHGGACLLLPAPLRRPRACCFDLDRKNLKPCADRLFLR